MRRSPTLVERLPRRVYLATLGLLLLGLVSLVAGGSAWTYRHVRARVDVELEQRLFSIGSAVAQSLAAVSLTAATPADSARRYASIERDLERISYASDLGGIDVVDRNRRRLAGTSRGVPFGARDPLIEAQPEASAALAGIAASTPLYEAEGIPGTFLKTGFFPIEDSLGVVVGLVAVEGGSGFFEIVPALRRVWWITGAASAILAAVLAALLLGLFRALERYERDVRATAALATAGQLAAMVAHEIRNPLAVLQSRAERVQEDLAAGGDREAAARLLDAIPAEVKRLDRILGNYLALARTGGSEGSCSVLPVLRGALDLMERDLARAGVESALESPPGDLRARVDPARLHQALINLFLNARDAMPHGGKLSVRASAEGRWIRIEVADTGIGIARNLRRRVFEPFFTTREGGSGLGLAVVDSIVRACGGRVALESEPGRGSRLDLWLPAHEMEETDGGRDEPL
ncbi:MAG: hypothetical protein FJY88_10815 [Candidatus Eisenbacteria bacterium]|nr:hypothetical protein [Candidatus Eisenbacteria bacterium]